MNHRRLALCAANLCLLCLPFLAGAAVADDSAPVAPSATPPAAGAAPATPYDASVEGFGFMDYKIGAAVDTKALEAAGFALDPYYDPQTYYSKEDTLPFTTGPEGYRLDIGVEDGKIFNIVVEFNIMLPSADGSTLTVRPHYKDIAVEIAQQLDAKYGAWDHETWEYNSDTFNMSVFDFLSDEYALSMRISTLAITMIYTTAENRQTQSDFEATVGTPSTPAPAAPAEAAPPATPTSQS